MITVGQRSSRLGDQTILYIIKRSSRAKYVRLEVTLRTGLTVVVPNSYDIRKIPDLLQAKRGWILGKLARYSQPPAIESALRSNDTILYLGRNVEVVARQNHGNIASVKLEQDRLFVNLRAGGAGLGLVLEQWYRMRAAEFISERANKLSARLGLTYNRLTIRGQKTRWGSCSHKGNLNFNWKLMMAPEPVIDYVVTHELAHLKEMNHTKRFWELVAQHCPRCREYRKWLKEHQAELALNRKPGNGA